MHFCRYFRAKPEEYESDPFNISFLNAYSEFRDPANDVELHLDVNDQELKGLGFVLEENGRAILPIDRDFLRPNRIYFFSLRDCQEQRPYKFRR